MNQYLYKKGGRGRFNRDEEGKAKTKLRKMDNPREYAKREEKQEDK